MKGIRIETRKVTVNHLDLDTKVRGHPGPIGYKGAQISSDKEGQNQDATNGVGSEPAMKAINARLANATERQGCQNQDATNGAVSEATINTDNVRAQFCQRTDMEATPKAKAAELLLLTLTQRRIIRNHRNQRYN